MIVEQSEVFHGSRTLRARLADYLQLVKMRLTLTVVLSAALGFILASGTAINWMDFSIVVLGGFLIVGASNGLNQVIERNYDKLMVRTANRPVATQRMSISEAVVFSALLGLTGVILFALYLNWLAAFLGFISLVLYAFLYTPLKRISNIAVFVGAFPGALPPAIGWVAATGSIDTGAVLIFTLQFFWQFPHFWAIAWILDEDYRRAGYHLLPSFEGRGKKSALQTVIYSFMLMPLAVLPYFYHITGVISAVITFFAGAWLTWLAVQLYKTCDDKDARKLMFGSFIYLPLVLLAYVFDKI